MNTEVTEQTMHKILVAPHLPPTKDLRSPLARARDEWLASKDGQICRQGPASGEYLENRLTMAFLAGVDWAIKHLKEKTGV